ncbi:MAG: TlpA family protein disulfide reductase [Actinobacteria bacterium]|nr:TlpA family protein disulfide reductase [Actinomycetota bacterium]
MTLKKFIAILFATVALTACGNSSQVATKSYISGNGAVTLVLNVWASWCSPCRAEAPTLAALADKYKGVVFVGVLTRDSEAAARAFQKRFNMPYPTLVDDSVLLGFRDTLSANAIPTTILMDPKGRVAARISGEITVASLSDLIEKLHSE